MRNEDKVKARESSKPEFTEVNEDFDDEAQRGNKQLSEIPSIDEAANRYLI